MRTTTLLIGLLLLATACAPAPDADMATRMANVEQRVAELEAARFAGGSGAPADAEPDSADAGAEVDMTASSQKERFAAMATGEDLESQLVAETPDVAIDAVRFDEQTDTLLVTARVGEGQDADIEAAWTMAQALAELWGGLTAFQPVLDLTVGDVRCACSARLMKDVQAGVADREAWQVACGQAV